MPTFIESVIPVRSIHKLSLAGQRLLSKGFQAICVNAQTVGKCWSKLIIQQPTNQDRAAFYMVREAGATMHAGSCDNEVE